MVEVQASCTSIVMVTLAVPYQDPLTTCPVSGPTDNNVHKPALAWGASTKHKHRVRQWFCFEARSAVCAQVRGMCAAGNC